ncbi:DUF1801 domain-containing protein [Halalkalibacillus halophilus]|uniref:DUF1801 domain-containing protein n=1 Tax=Halalkalibacillus halophilus TaxID=392827 RepID=UPI0003F93C67|nr:DUF1801 domain-containing protein [Halalkalibacillus halophilus]
MSKDEQFQYLFTRLKTTLQQYEHNLVVKKDDESTYYLDSPKDNPINGSPHFFASVSIKKNYVSFHLMPVYYYPALLEQISPELKKRMQGKSCFNFKKHDEVVLSELEELTHSSYEKFKQEEII